MHHTHRIRRGGCRLVSTAFLLSTVLVLINQSNALLTYKNHGSSLTNSRVGRSGSTLFPLQQPDLMLSRSKHIQHQNRKNNIQNTVCYYKYADEWMDAKKELAFHNSKAGVALYHRGAPTSTNTLSNNKSTTKKKKSSISSSLLSSILKRILHQMYNKCYQLKENIRTRIERCTVYVLQCEDNKYYVGSTTNRKRRYNEHAKRRGSKWTKTYAPLNVVAEYKRIPQKFLLGYESKVTAETMLKYGVNNVRGSMFCSVRDYHIGDIDALTKFLGHYNDMNYGKVNKRLSETLPDIPEKFRRKRKNRYNNSSMDGRCYTCGELGHIAASCPQRYDYRTMTLRP